jgi:predicted amidohydrolase
LFRLLPKGGFLRLGFLQTQPRFGEPAANLAAIETALAGVCDATIVLPELCTTGYIFGSRAETRSLAEPADGPTVQRLRRLAHANHLVLCCGMAEKDGDKLYNSAVTVLPSGRVHVYRKAHLFDREKLVFDRAVPQFEPLRAGTRLGVMICFDWIFPEVCRSLALAGARVILHPSNLVLPYCQAAMVTRAVENRIFTVTCNRTGMEERAGVRLRFTGQSRIVDPRGRVLAQAGEEEESLQIIDIDPAEAADKHITRRNDLFRDRRQYRLG